MITVNCPKWSVSSHTANDQHEPAVTRRCAAWIDYPLCVRWILYIVTAALRPPFHHLRSFPYHLISALQASSTRDSASRQLLIVSGVCLHREQFLKSNAQLTFRCRQLLSELSYIYPIDVVSSTRRVPAAQHICWRGNCKWLSADRSEALIGQQGRRSFPKGCLILRVMSFESSPICLTWSTLQSLSFAYKANGSYADTTGQWGNDLKWVSPSHQVFISSLKQTSYLYPQANQSDYVICGVKLPNSEDFQGNVLCGCVCVSGLQEDALW